MASGMILAAGYGTRLLPLTLELPKPAVPVGDRALIAHVLEACARAGLSPLLVNVHHQADKLVNKLECLETKSQVLIEHEIRGTAGGVAGGRGLFGPGEVLVWNADILTEPPLAALLETARAADAQVLAISPKPAGAGNLGLAADGRVVRLRGQRFGEEVQGGDYIGVMALGPQVVRGLPERGCLIGDVALPALARGEPVFSVPSAAPWSDLGDIESYARANFAWLLRQPAGVRASFVAPGVEVSSRVVLERCLLGRGARVEGEGSLARVIAWPNAPVRAPLSDAIVLTSGLVVPLLPASAGPESSEN